jgi:hypothetical protein
MVNQQYPYMTDVSGMNSGMQDTRSQDALHQALLLRTSQMNPQTQPSQQSNNMLAQALRQNRQNSSIPTNTTGENPATGEDWLSTGSGYAGNGGYYPNGQYGGIDSWLSGSSGIDNSALGGYNTSGLDLSSLTGGTGGMADWLGGLGDWFGGLFSGGGALAGAGEVAAEAAPVAAAAL